MKIMSTTSQFAPIPDGLTENDKCHDRDDPDGILVVLERTGDVAANFEMAEGISAADVYDEYPPHDEMIVCAYKRDLETAGEATRLHYPEGKLDLYAAGNYTEHEDGTVCEHCGEAVADSSAWVEHIIRYCKANPA